MIIFVCKYRNNKPFSLQLKSLVKSLFRAHKTQKTQTTYNQTESYQFSDVPTKKNHLIW
jgi:hypothetical protein